MECLVQDHLSFWLLLPLFLLLHWLICVVFIVLISTDPYDRTSKVAPSNHEHCPRPASSPLGLLHLKQFRYIVLRLGVQWEKGSVDADLRCGRGVEPCHSSDRCFACFLRGGRAVGQTIRLPDKVVHCVRVVVFVRRRGATR